MDVIYLLLAVLAWLGAYGLLHACLKLQTRGTPSPAGTTQAPGSAS